MDDIVLVTADSVRYDYATELPSLSSLSTYKGVAGANYTRPSLATLHSSNFRAAVQTRVVQPTLAETLSEAGYTCLGFSPNPNTHEQFGFGHGFTEYDAYMNPGSRGNSLRQYLAKFDPLKRIYYRLFPPQAKYDDRPSDASVVDDAISAFNDNESPRFLWIHLMESHIPYGQGAKGLSQRLTRNALLSPESLTEDERDTIERTYQNALQRVDHNVNRLLDGIDSDPLFVFTADHGEAFGEPGYYFHPGQERPIEDVIIDVPVMTDDLDPVGPRLSLLDIAPSILSAIGVESPNSWHGEDITTHKREHTLTIAPWHNKATLCWQDSDTKIVARDSKLEISTETGTDRVERGGVPTEIEEQLRDLGYVDAG